MDERADGLVAGVDRLDRPGERRISRKLAGSDAALEVGERDHWHYSPGKMDPLLRSAPQWSKSGRTRRQPFGAQDPFPAFSS